MNGGEYILRRCASLQHSENYCVIKWKERTMRVRQGKESFARVDVSVRERFSWKMFFRDFVQNQFCAYFVNGKSYDILSLTENVAYKICYKKDCFETFRSSTRFIKNGF